MKPFNRKRNLVSKKEKVKGRDKEKREREFTPQSAKTLITVLVLSLIVVLLGAFKIIQDTKTQSALAQQTMQQTINNATRSVYVAAVPIAQQQIITQDMLMAVNQLYTDDSTLFFSNEDIGSTAVVDIAQGQTLLKNMIASDQGANLYERECGFIWLSTNLKENDLVDIRILFPNGEDYVVVPKKALKSLQLASNNVFLWLTEDEILLLDSAVVDANLNGAKIYTTRYVQPELQSASAVTYHPNVDVQEVIDADPNIIDQSKKNVSAAARRGMEARIAQFREANPNFVIGDTTESWQKKQEELDSTVISDVINVDTGATVSGSAGSDSNNSGYGSSYGDLTTGNENLNSGQLNADTSEEVEIEYVN